jgi:hypothetical protein
MNTPGAGVAVGSASGVELGAGEFVTVGDGIEDGVVTGVYEGEGDGVLAGDGVVSEAAAR